MADPTTTLAPPSSRSGDGADTLADVPAVVEPPNTSPPNVPPSTRPDPPSVELPATIEPKGKVARITDQTVGIVNDVKTWVDLRIALAKQEVRDEVETRTRPFLETAKTLQLLARDEIAKPLGVALFGALLAAIFLLFTLSFAFAALYVWWFASLHAGLALGFLTTTLILALTMVIAGALAGNRYERAKEAANQSSKS